MRFKSDIWVVGHQRFLEVAHSCEHLGEQKADRKRALSHEAVGNRYCGFDAECENEGS